MQSKCFWEGMEGIGGTVALESLQRHAGHHCYQSHHLVPGEEGRGQKVVPWGGGGEGGGGGGIVWRREGKEL